MALRFLGRGRLVVELVVVAVVCLVVVVETRKQQREICPFPCVCHNDEAFCDGKEIFSIPLHLPAKTTLLNTKNNYIRRLRHVQLHHLRKLKTLILRNNRIDFIEPNTFWRLRQVQSITLRDNDLRSVPPDIFKGLYNLQQVSFRNNHLHSVEYTFKGLRNLRLLSLGDNKITTITARTFRSNVRLYVLDVHNNSLSHIHRSAFRRLPYLRYLILRDNPLFQMALDFQFNYHMELLDLTACHLKRVVRGLPTSIRDLRMSENNITTLEPLDLKQTRKIRMLMLSQNRIRVINNETFGKLNILYELNLSNNTLRRMPVNLPRSLRTLYVVNNSIARVEDSDLQGNDKLETLLLNINKITSIGQAAFKHLSRLQTLDLSSNRILELQPFLFERTGKLQLLDLSNNPLRHADHRCFTGLTNLHILQLSSLGAYSHIKPTIFQFTGSLLFLDLSNSSALAASFTESPFLLDYIGSVEDLNLMGDNMFGLPADFPNHFPKLRVIKLVGNPWHCDQQLYWMTKWMQNGSVAFHEENHMLCHSPPELRGRRISSLTLAEIPTAPPPREDITPEVDVIDIEFTLGKNYTLLVGEEDAALNKSLLEALKGSTILNYKPGSDMDAVLQLTDDNIVTDEGEQKQSIKKDQQSKKPTKADITDTDMSEATNTNYIDPPVTQKRKKHSKEYRDYMAKKRLDSLLNKKKKGNNVKVKQDNEVEEEVEEELRREEVNNALLSLDKGQQHDKYSKDNTYWQLEDFESGEGSGELHPWWG